MNATIVRAIAKKNVAVARASLLKSTVSEINQVFTRSNAGVKFKPYTILDVAITESRGDPIGSPGRQIVDLLRAAGARTFMELIHMPPLPVVRKKGTAANGIRTKAAAPTVTEPLRQSTAVAAPLRLTADLLHQPTAAAPAPLRLTAAQLHRPISAAEALRLTADLLHQPTATTAAAPLRQAAAPLRQAAAPLRQAAAAPIQVQLQNSRQNQAPLRLTRTPISGISITPAQTRRRNNRIIVRNTRNVVAHPSIRTPSTMITGITVKQGQRRRQGQEQGQGLGGKRRRKYSRYLN